MTRSSLTSKIDLVTRPKNVSFLQLQTTEKKTTPRKIHPTLQNCTRKYPRFHVIKENLTGRSLGTFQKLARKNGQQEPKEN